MCIYIYIIINRTLGNFQVQKVKHCNTFALANAYLRIYSIIMVWTRRKYIGKYRVPRLYIVRRCTQPYFTIYDRVVVFHVRTHVRGKHFATDAKDLYFMVAQSWTRQHTQYVLLMMALTLYTWLTTTQTHTQADSRSLYIWLSLTRNNSEKHDEKTTERK